MRKVWFLLPLLAILVVGASFAGCVGSSGSSHSATPTPVATVTATPTPTPTSTPKGGGPTPIPPPTGTPTPTPHPSKALVGFVIGFKVINFTWSKDGGKTWESVNQMFGGYYPLLLMVQTYLVYPNGTKVFMLAPYEKNYGCNCFYVIGFNRTQGWHGINYLKYKLPFWGSTKFYFSTVWNKTTFYQKILPLLEKGAKIELVMGFTTTGANFNNFTDAVELFTKANPLPLMCLNWTPGQNLTKTFIYSWTGNIKGTLWYGYKFKIYVEIWIKPVYMPWGQYPSPVPPSMISGNDYNVWS